MQIIEKKSFNLLLIMTLILSLLIPTFVWAYEIEGDVDNPTLTIHKFEQDPEKELVGNGDPLSDVEFTLTQTHKYNPDTDEWTEVNGESTTHMTDDNGKIVINNIDLGRYKVQETDGPPHVNLNRDEYFVDIPMTSSDGTTLNYDVHIYPKNETIRGAVELFKIDGEAETEVGLGNVVFDLYNSNDQLIETLTTDADGYIRVDGLAFGDYYFKEVSAPGDYVVIGSKIPFSIAESGTIDESGNSTGTVVQLEVTNYEAPSIEKTVEEKKTHETNRETDFTYNLKIALPEDIASYDEFIITDVLDERLSYTEYWEVVGADENAFEFNQNGQTLTWKVVNFQALDNIESITINFTAEINGDAPAFDPIENNANIDFTNDSGTTGKKTPTPAIVIPVEGSLKIVKQDGDTEERLLGAEFELRDLEGNVVKSDISDSNGEINWTGLDYGEYTLVETKSPEGYRILTKPIDVTIDDNNNELTIVVDNTKTGWELPTTGGIGTIMFTVVGLTLMSIAAILYVRRRIRVTNA